ncbi:MAG: hypothetical protein ACI35O_02590 [Bacillaceae bacterium]
MKVNMNVVSAMILGISILSAAYIGKMETKKEKVDSNQNEGIKRVIDKQLLTTSEVAIYLGISTEEISRILAVVNEPDNEGVVHNGISFIQIDHVTYYPKKAIDKWLEHVGGIQLVE